MTHKKFMITVSVAIIACVGLMIYVGFAEVGEHKRLMAQCIQDGKKEYECEVLLRKPQAQIVPIPVYQ